MPGPLFALVASVLAGTHATTRRQRTGGYEAQLAALAAIGATAAAMAPRHVRMSSLCFLMLHLPSEDVRRLPASGSRG